MKPVFSPETNQEKLPSVVGGVYLKVANPSAAEMLDPTCTPFTKKLTVASSNGSSSKLTWTFSSIGVSANWVMAAPSAGLT